MKGKRHSPENVVRKLRGALSLVGRTPLARWPTPLSPECPRMHDQTSLLTTPRHCPAVAAPNQRVVLPAKCDAASVRGFTRASRRAAAPSRNP